MDEHAQNSPNFKKEKYQSDIKNMDDIRESARRHSKRNEQYKDKKSKAYKEEFQKQLNLSNKEVMELGV